MMAEVPSPMGSARASLTSNGSEAASPAGGESTFDRHLFDSFELVYTRVTEGRHDLKKLKTYMETRADMAKTYCKTYKKACEQLDLENSSSIEGVWRNMRDFDQLAIKTQEAFAAACLEIAATLESQIVEIKKTKTALHAQWTKLVADVKKKQQIHDKARKEYVESVNQAETAVMNRDAAHEQKMPEKAIQKADARAKQCLKEVDTLHAAYQKSVAQLKEAQETYDATTADLLQQFERHERTRMRVFLDQLDKYAGQYDGLEANMKEIGAALHGAVNAVNIPRDIQEFIRAHATGKPPTPHVAYEPRVSKIIDHAQDFKPANAVGGGAMMASAPSPMSAAGSANKAASSPMSAGGPPPMPGSSFGTAAGGETAIALFDFEQKEPDDLPFKTGDIIRLLSCPENEDWWQGVTVGSDRVGIFPKSYVQKQASTPAASSTRTSVASPPPPPVQAAPPSSPPPPAPVSPGPPPAPVQAAAPPAAPVAAAPVQNPFGEVNEPASSAEGAPGGAEVPKQMDARCAALFDFDGQDEDELSFKVGQQLIITGELNGWYLGKVEGTEKIGIFPSNYVDLNA